jgi:hypothetical protein
MSTIIDYMSSHPACLTAFEYESLGMWWRSWKGGSGARNEVEKNDEDAA